MLVCIWNMTYHIYFLPFKGKDERLIGLAVDKLKQSCTILSHGRTSLASGFIYQLNRELSQQELTELKMEVWDPTKYSDASINGSIAE